MTDQTMNPCREFDAACDKLEDRYGFDDTNVRFHDVGALRGYCFLLLSAWQAAKADTAHCTPPASVQELNKRFCDILARYDLYDGLWPDDGFTLLLNELLDATQLEARDKKIAVYEEALTPSAETKAVYIGKFGFNIELSDDEGEIYIREVTVPWTTIKEVMAAVKARALAKHTGNAGEG